MERDKLAKAAVREALRLRARLKIRLDQALCPFDVAERLGIVVRIESVPSLEGLYVPASPPVAVLGADRPAGRRAHTCAHEIGHHIFGHGTCLAQLGSQTGDGWDPEEFLANRFATALLMPKIAVESAFSRRGWKAARPSPEQLFVASQDLGVGYANLLNHLANTMRLLAKNDVQGLRAAGRRLPEVRSRLAGRPVERDLLVADVHWGVRPIDVEVGDLILVPSAVELHGSCLVREERAPRLLRAVSQGVGEVRLASSRPRSPVRVCRRGFAGLARYRHLEDPEDG